MVNAYAPATLAEALELRAAHDLIPYAGGTDLMIAEEREGSYLFLHNIESLKTVREDADNFYFGSGCTFTALLNHAKTPAILKEALAGIAAPAIRNAGTIGGNIANASPKADSALIFFVTDSNVKLENRHGERVLPIRDLYLGRGKIDINKDELITEIIMPKKYLGDYYYRKIGARKALSISRLSFAGLFSEKDGTIEHVACAFGAVSDVIIRYADIDAMLIGRTLAEATALKEDYLKAYDESIIPLRGRVSSEYRKTVCMNLLRDFLAEHI